MIISHSHPSFGNAQIASYMLTADGAYYSIDYIKTKKLSGFTQKLSNESYLLLKNLAANIPDRLLNSSKSSETFGCPGCADQGGYSVELIKGNSSKQFYLDTQVQSLPVDLRDFATQVGATLQQLR